MLVFIGYKSNDETCRWMALPNHSAHHVIISLISYNISQSNSLIHLLMSFLHAIPTTILSRCSLMFSFSSLNRSQYTPESSFSYFLTPLEDLINVL